MKPVRSKINMEGKIISCPVFIEANFSINPLRKRVAFLLKAKKEKHTPILIIQQLFKESSMIVSFEEKANILLKK